MLKPAGDKSIRKIPHNAEQPFLCPTAFLSPSGAQTIQRAVGEATAGSAGKMVSRKTVPLLFVPPEKVVP
jgi:hypothetical protein